MALGSQRLDGSDQGHPASMYPTAASAGATHQDGMYPDGTHPEGSDAVRTALAMVRADWQGDPESWNELYAVCDDPAELARQLTHLCRQTLDQLAGVAGVSSGEMLHRLATRLIPHPEAGHVTMVDLRALDPDNGHHPR